MSAAPILYTWTGEAMVPLARFASRCDKTFVIGEVYRMEIVEERSQRSHSHFFARVKEYHDSLPDYLAERFPTPEHLRKWALIQAGYANRAEIACRSHAEAARTIATIKALDEYAVAVARDNILVVLTAQSQSTKAMGAKVFQESKEKVFSVLDDLLGTTKEREAA